MSKTHRLIATCFLALAITAAGITTGTEDAAAWETSTSEQTDFKAPFRAGSFDFTLGAGWAGFVYPHIEPGVEFGLIPLGNDLTLGVGAVLDVGYCLLCPLVSLIPGYSLSSWYANPMARANLHIGSVAQILEMPNLDAYVGGMAGPAIYRVTVKVDDRGVVASATETRTTLMLGPVLGARISLDDRNRWLIFGEARFLLEVGFGETVVRIQDYEYRESGTTTRGGMDVVFGLGMRI
jgi:hypothetical protein